MNAFYHPKSTKSVSVYNSASVAGVYKTERLFYQSGRLWVNVLFGFWLLLQISVGRANDICVIVNVNSNIATLNEQQVKDIFLGQLLEYPEGSKIIPVDQVDGSQQKEQFYALITQKSEHQMRAYWAKLVFSGKGIPPKEVGDATAVKKLVTEYPNMIGYINKDQLDASVKVVFSPQK